MYKPLLKTFKAYLHQRDALARRIMLFLSYQTEKVEHIVTYFEAGVSAKIVLVHLFGKIRSIAGPGVLSDIT